jgi:hypothetical protein
MLLEYAIPLVVGLPAYPVVPTRQSDVAGDLFRVA